jgi:hypothetical protein
MGETGLGWVMQQEGITLYRLLVLQHGGWCQQAQEDVAVVRTLWGERAAPEVLG